MIDKTVASVEEAVADIRDDAVISIGGFGYAGTPFSTYMALADRSTPPRGLTLVGIAYTTVGLSRKCRGRKKGYRALPGISC